MIYSAQLQATHCQQPPAWKGVWRDAKGRSHYVEACREHAPKGNAAMVETPGVGQGESVSPGSPPVLRTGRATVLDGFDVAQVPGRSVELAAERLTTGHGWECQLQLAPL
jgi:hypothetical protein